MTNIATQQQQAEHGDAGAPQPQGLAATARTKRSAFKVFGLLGGFKVATLLLLWLLWLTFIGTWYQKDFGLIAAQRRFFDSFFFFAKVGPFGCYYPGGATTMILLAINLIVGGLIRIRKSTATIGILIAHVGILFLLASGAVKFLTSKAGQLMLWPDETSSQFTAWYDWEIVVAEQLSEGSWNQHTILDADFTGMSASDSRTFKTSVLPFDIKIFGFTQHGEPRQVGHGANGRASTASNVDGFRLVALKPNKDAEHDIAGCYVLLSAKDGSHNEIAILWGRSEHPYLFEFAGKRYGVQLRRSRFELPFSLRLEEFRMAWHPGTRKPKSFESDVIVADDGGPRAVRISMNRPLRAGGYIVYQSNWGPQHIPNPEKFYSIFEISDNPADKWPEWACYVIAFGLLVHFSMKLNNWVRAETVRVRRAS
ncbi:MAG: hypothetical protein CMJ85_04165 [Planctomycetes bacterium]|nr:hypothetical protein [Planctomycetota bacterium]